MQASPEMIVALPAARVASAAPPSTDAALLTVTGGSAAALLVLYGFACVADMAGCRLPGLIAALDPVHPGSLPELWGAGWLLVAAVLSLAVGFRANNAALLGLGLLPAALALVEATDLAARLEPAAAAVLGISSGLPAAKLLADGLASGLVLAAALGAALGTASRTPATSARAGRRCLVAVLAAGGASVACDLAGSSLSPTLAATWMLHTVEESLELGLYSVVAATVLAATFRTVSDRSSINGTELPA